MALGPPPLGSKTSRCARAKDGLTYSLNIDNGHIPTFSFDLSGVHQTDKKRKDPNENEGRQHKSDIIMYEAKHHTGHLGS